MAGNYWKKQREVIFPDIKDWKGPKSELRKNTISFWHMFYFDQDMYALIKYGTDISSLLMFTVLPCVIAYLTEWWMLFIAAAISLVWFGRQLYITHISREWWYGQNLYDILLRDYLYEEEKNDGRTKKTDNKRDEGAI